MSRAGDPQAREMALALAAAVEAARLVDQLARTGTAPVTEMKVLSDSLFRFEWQNVAEVYGGIGNLQRGLRLLEAMLQDPSAIEHRNVVRYTLAMMHLGRLLAHDRARLAKIRTRLEHAGVKSEHFASSFEGVAASIAGIYQDTISTYRYRIQVMGSSTHLNDRQVADRIRTLLLAGLRAIVLWRHLGGSRTGLVLGRARLLAACRDLPSLH